MCCVGSFGQCTLMFSFVCIVKYIQKQSSLTGIICTTKVVNFSFSCDWKNTLFIHTSDNC